MLGPHWGKWAILVQSAYWWISQPDFQNQSIAPKYQAREEKEMSIFFFGFWFVINRLIRSTQSIMHVPLQVNGFQKIILLIVHYNIWNPVPEILFSRIWSSAQGYAVLGLLLNPVVFLISGWQKSVSRKWFVLAVYQVWKGISAGPALEYFTYFIGAGGLIAGLTNK